MAASRRLSKSVRMSLYLDYRAPIQKLVNIPFRSEKSFFSHERCDSAVVKHKCICLASINICFPGHNEWNRGQHVLDHKVVLTMTVAVCVHTMTQQTKQRSWLNKPKIKVLIHGVFSVQFVDSTVATRSTGESRSVGEGTLVSFYFLHDLWQAAFLPTMTFYDILCITVILAIDQQVSSHVSKITSCLNCYYQGCAERREDSAELHLRANLASSRGSPSASFFQAADRDGWHQCRRVVEAPHFQQW